MLRDYPCSSIWPLFNIEYVDWCLKMKKIRPCKLLGYFQKMDGH